MRAAIWAVATGIAHTCMGKKNINFYRKPLPTAVQYRYNIAITAYRNW